MAIYQPAWTDWATTSTSNSTAVTLPNLAWHYWATTASTTSVTTTYGHRDAAWQRWSGTCMSQPFYETPAYGNIASEQECRRIAMEQWAARDKERIEKQEAAQRKALMLLLAILNEQQRAEYLEKKHFHVTGQSGKRYRVRQGVHSNIDMVDTKGEALKHLCVAPLARLPQEDHMAAQVLYLLHNEADLLRTANITDAETGAVQVGQGLQAV